MTTSQENLQCGHDEFVVENYNLRSPIDPSLYLPSMRPRRIRRGEPACAGWASTGMPTFNAATTNSSWRTPRVTVRTAPMRACLQCGHDEFVVENVAVL